METNTGVEEGARVNGQEKVEARKNVAIQFMQQRWFLTLSCWLMLILLAVLIVYSIAHVKELQVANVCQACIQEGYNCWKIR